MKVWVLTAAALLLAQLSLAPAHVEALGDGAALPARQLGAGGPTDNHRPAGDGGDNEADDSHPQVRAEHHPGSGAPCKATGSGMQHPPQQAPQEPTTAVPQQEPGAEPSPEGLREVQQRHGKHRACLPIAQGAGRL